MYTVYHKNFWQCMHSISMLFANTWESWKMFGKFIQVCWGKKSSTLLKVAKFLIE